MSSDTRYELSFTAHAKERLLQRGIAIGEIIAVLTNPRRCIYRSEPGRNATWRYRHVDHTDLVVVTDGAVVVTAFRQPSRN